MRAERARHVHWIPAFAGMTGKISAAVVLRRVIACRAN
jgi:hypothetical protein